MPSRGRHLLRKLAIAWIFLANPSETPAAAVDEHRATSLVLITIDTLRADHVGVYGGPVATPYLDRLASQGVLVESAYTPTPSTGPAHVSLLTGLHLWRHRTLQNAVPLDPRLPTLADLLGQGGLETGAFVSSYILHRRFGFHQGFATYVFEPSEEYTWRGKLRPRFWTRGEETARAANRWLTKHAEQPFFLWVHFFDPHWPYRPPVGFRVPPKDPVKLKGKKLPRDQSVRGIRHLKDLIRSYRGEIAYVDAQVGKLLERLRLLGAEKRTAVILTSDHGEGLGDHGIMEHGHNVFEELVRVPLIVRAPGVPAGRRVSGPAQLEDLTPTILAILGVAPPSTLDGVDLLPWLRGEVDISPRTAIVGGRAANKGKNRVFYIREGSKKWIGPRDGPGLIYDLDGDPGESNPGESAAMPSRLAEIFRLTEANGEGTATTPPDPETLRALQALGYAD